MEKIIKKTTALICLAAVFHAAHAVEEETLSHCLYKRTQKVEINATITDKGETYKCVNSYDESKNPKASIFILDRSPFASTPLTKPIYGCNFKGAPSNMIKVGEAYDGFACVPNYTFDGLGNSASAALIKLL